MRTKWGGKLQNGEAEVWVSALDEDRMAIEILGGKDDVRFTCSMEAFQAVVESYITALQDRDDKIAIQKELELHCPGFS